MAKRRAKSVREARRAANTQESEEIVKAPHSFVINRGNIGKNGEELMMNFRKIMEPFTAARLHVKKKNVLKDFINMAGTFHVSHLIMFSKSENYMNFKIAKLPRGPTLSFQIKEYSLCRDVLSAQKKPQDHSKIYMHHPLLVLNNFSGEGMHLKLMTSMFQNMIPTINVNKVKLNAIRRCLLIHCNEDKTLEIRQYVIKVAPTGLSRPVRKLLGKKVPDLSKCHDISDYLNKPSNLSESEAELDGDFNTVTLSQPMSSKGNMVSQKSAIRLYEIGPRMTLKLVKIEEGIVSGEVLYHAYITKTPEEIAAAKARTEAKRLLKEQRRLIQRQNVAKKKKEMIANVEEDDEKEEKEDIEWYKKEVGQNPGDDFFAHAKRKKTSSFIRQAKKSKIQSEEQEPSKKTKTANFTKSSKNIRLMKGKNNPESPRNGKKGKFAKKMKKAGKEEQASKKFKKAGFDKASKNTKLGKGKKKFENSRKTKDGKFAKSFNKDKFSKDKSKSPMQAADWHKKRKLMKEKLKQKKKR